jgi:hypothetical protein
MVGLLTYRLADPHCLLSLSVRIARFVQDAVDANGTLQLD